MPLSTLLVALVAAGACPADQRLLDGGADSLVAVDRDHGTPIDARDDGRLAADAGEDPRLTIMVISDTHVREPDHPDSLRLAEAVDRLERGDHYPKVDLLMITGDLVDSMWADSIWTGNEGPQATAERSRLKTAVALLDQLSIPYLPVIGNHEYYLAPGKYARTAAQADHVATVWKQLTGRETYYHVDRGGFRLVVLDSARGWCLRDQRFDPAQIEWLETEVFDTELPVLLFLHHPIRTDHELQWDLLSHAIPREDAPRFFELLEAHAGQIRAIFVGHGHLWVRDTLGTIPVYETPSFGKHLPHPDRYHLCRLDGERGTVEIVQGREAPYIEASGL